MTGNGSLLDNIKRGFMDKLIDLPVLGIFFKYMKIKQMLGRIEKEFAMNETVLREYQLSRLKEVAVRAYENIPMYRKKWKAAGVRPEDLETLEDLSKFPVITKDDIRSVSVEEIINQSGHRKNYHVFRTTGSSGMPLAVLYDREKSFYEIAEISSASINLHFGLNLKTGMSIMVMDDDALEVLPAMEFSQAKKYLFDAKDDVEKHIRQINTVKPDYLMTYPSVLKNISIKLQAEKQTIHQPALLFTTAETHDAHTRKIIQETFKGKILDGYAATEMGLMAVECDRHNGLHVLPYKSIIEIVDNQNRMLPPGETGNVVVTDLNNMALPIIRYSGMGDLASYRTEVCACRMARYPLLKRIEGRKMDTILLPGDKIVHPFKLTSLMLDLPDVNKFQIRQEEKNIIRVLIVEKNSQEAMGGSRGTGEAYQELKNRFQSVVGSDVAVDFEYVDDILPKNNTHKFQLVVSKVHG